MQYATDVKTARMTAVRDEIDAGAAAGVMLRGVKVVPGNKLAFIAVSTSGNVYLTPGG